MEFVIVGGSYFYTKNKNKALEQHKNNVFEYYGTSKTGVNTLTKITLQDNLHSTPLKKIDFKILDEKGIIKDEGMELLIHSYEIYNGINGI
ncbi:MAG: hypothetical protein ACK5HR_00710 [Mycoplasmatales bacterium]